MIDCTESKERKNSEHATSQIAAIVNLAPSNIAAAVVEDRTVYFA